jgi:hypothetical protein
LSWRKIPPGSYFFSLGLRVATGCWRSARDRQHGVTPHQGVDRGWIGPWTKSLAHLKVQRYQCCASDDLIVMPQPLCPYRVWVPYRARMPLRAAAEPAGESFPEPPQHRAPYRLGAPNRISNPAKDTNHGPAVGAIYLLSGRAPPGVTAVIDLA